MKNGEQISWRKSTYFRTVLAFLSVMLPLMILFLYSFRWYSEQLTKRALEENQNQVKNYLIRMDKDIERLCKYTSTLLNERDLQVLAISSEIFGEYEKSQAVNRICSRLNSIKGANEYIENVRAFLPALGWAINAPGWSGGNYSEITPEEMKEAMDLGNLSSQMLSYSDGKLTMKLPSSERTPDKLPAFMIEIEFSESKMLQNYIGSSNYQDYPCAIEQQELGFFYANPLAVSFFEAEENRKLSYESNREEDIIRYGAKGERFLLISEEAAGSGMRITQLIPENEVQKDLRVFRLLNFAVLLVFTAVISYILLSFYVLIRVPMTKLTQAFKKLEAGDFKVRIEENRNTDFGYLYCKFNQMTEHLSRLIDEVYTQKILVQKAELKQLQTQINPHFFYNSYFLLHRLIKMRDYEKATAFSKELGTYFQFVTRSAKDVVPFSKEYTHARIYADIQAMRFEGRIEVFFDEMPEQFEEFEVPRLIIQPIIENAFEHSLENKPSDGILQIHFEAEENNLLVIVEDNGEGLTEEALQMMQDKIAREDMTQEITGMLNIHLRIHKMYGEKSGLFLERSALGGLKAVIRMEGGEKIGIQTVGRG